MTPPQENRISGVNLIIQSKIKRFELLHPVPIALSKSDPHKIYETHKKSEVIRFAADQIDSSGSMGVTMGSLWQEKGIPRTKALLQGSILSARCGPRKRSRCRSPQ